MIVRGDVFMSLCELKSEDLYLQSLKHPSGSAAGEGGAEQEDLSCSLCLIIARSKPNFQGCVRVHTHTQTHVGGSSVEIPSSYLIICHYFTCCMEEESHQHIAALLSGPEGNCDFFPDSGLLEFAGPGGQGIFN